MKAGWLVAFGVMIVCLAAADDPKPGTDDAWTSLVAAERAFSDDCAARGARVSFLAHFEPGVLTFPPGKSLRVGTTHLHGSEPESGVLTWRPVKAEVSTSGDLGYTTGPWELRNHRGDAAPAATGSFVSVWRRRPNGPWKVLADFGHTGPQPADARADVVRPRPRKPLQKPGPTPGERVSAVESQFNDASKRSAESAYGRYLANDARFYRDGSAPLLGKEAIVKSVATMNADVTWHTERARIADGGDIGYTTGTMTVQRKRPAGAPPTYLKYLRIWRNEGGSRWKVVLEIANGAPAPRE